MTSNPFIVPSSNFFYLPFFLREMDDFISSILRDLNLTAYTKAFEDNKISKPQLMFLVKNDNYLTNLIPNFGDRLAFACYATQKIAMDSDNGSVGSGSQGANTNASTSSDKASLVSIESTSVSAECNNVGLFTTLATAADGNNSVESTETVQEVSFISRPVSPTVPGTNDMFPPPKRQRITESTSLRSKISKTLSGLALLASFERKTSFDNSSWTKLAHIIISEEFGLNSATEISATRFRKLAEEICEEFPGEDNRVWYTPAVTKDSKTAIPKGKLYDQYTSICKDLRDAGLRSSRRGKPELRTSLVRGSELPLSDLTDLEIDERLDFLQVNIEEWDLISDNWLKTVQKRLSDLRSQSDTNGGENAYIFQYIGKYPALKQPRGHTLLEIDFKALYPSAHGRIFSEWDTFIGKLKRQLEIESVNHSGFTSDVEWLHAYAGLFSSVPIKVSKGKAWKPAKTEILDGFLLHIKDINELTKTLQYLTQRNKAKGLSVQPFPMIAGKTLKTITQSYFVIDGRPLLLESPRHAVACAFYAYHALYTNYPTQSARLWVVLERALFGVEDPNDTTSEEIARFPEVRRLIASLKV